MKVYTKNNTLYTKNPDARGLLFIGFLIGYCSGMLIAFIISKIIWCCI